MKCTNQVLKTHYISPGITNGTFELKDCGGEMEEKGEIKHGTGKDTVLSIQKLYQCKVCKDIKIV